MVNYWLWPVLTPKLASGGSIRTLLNMLLFLKDMSQKYIPL